ncbi:MAG: hypothetical protein KDD53_01475 [Bdellovibrionales bacterium]|nr:hypothetical protein [Bdellovibrionales bacterium]
MVEQHPSSSSLSTTKLSLAPEQLSRIRERFANACAVGFDEKRLATLNDEIAAEFGCSLPQIRAVQSQMKIRGDRVLRDLKLDTVLPRETLIAAYEDWLIGSQYSEDEANEAAAFVINSSASRPLNSSEISLVMSQFHLALENPKSTSRTLSRSIAETIDHHSGEIAQGPNLDLCASLPDNDLANDVIAGEEDTGTGCHVPHIELFDGQGPEYTDYDFPAKRAWRVEIVDTVDRLLKDIPRELRAKIHVLFLPSVNRRNMEVQVRLLESIGFARECMHGVEGTSNPVLRERFQQDAREIGFIPVMGKLQTVLAKDPTAYGFVWLDFPGPQNNTYLEIMKYIYLADRAVVSVNLMEGREGAKVQQGLDINRLLNTEGGFQYILEHQDLVFENDWDFESIREGVGANERLSASELREEVGLAQLFGVIGDCRLEDLKNCAAELQKLPHPDLCALQIRIASRIALRHFGEGLNGALRQYRSAYLEDLRAASRGRGPFTLAQRSNIEFQIRQAMEGDITESIIMLAEAYCAYRTNFTRVERCRYQSEAAGRKWFYSVTARAENPRSRYDALGRSGSVLRDLLVDYSVRNLDSDLNARQKALWLTDERGRPAKVSGPDPKKSDIIHFGYADENGNMNSAFSLRMGHLRGDLATLRDLLRLYKEVPFCEWRKINQKVISGEGA